MRPALALRRIADDVFEISVPSAEEAQSLAAALRAGWQAEDVVAGLSSVAVRFDLEDAASVEAWLKTASSQIAPETQALPVIELDVFYGGEYGPDLDLVCAKLAVSKDAFIEQHSAIEHRVDMIGFTPGFSYMSGIPEGWAIPRLSDPRPRVATGSVGLSAGYTGIYALAGPGGWPLVGRTSAQLFDPNKEEPFLLSPGQRVRFRPR